MMRGIPYMVLDVTKRPGDPTAVKTGDMLLAENRAFRKTLASIADNLRIHLLVPTQNISMNRAEVEAMVRECEVAL